MWGMGLQSASTSWSKVEVYARLPPPPLPFTKVTEVNQGGPINDPYTGAAQSGAPAVAVPISSMTASASDFGTDVEVKLVVHWGDGNQYEMYYRNFRLDQVFDHTTTSDHDGPTSPGDVVYCRAGTSGPWTSSTGGVRHGNGGWNWKFETRSNNMAYNTNCGFLLHRESSSNMDAGIIYNGPMWGMGSQSGSTSWSKVEVFARLMSPSLYTPPIVCSTGYSSSWSGEHGNTGIATYPGVMAQIAMPGDYKHNACYAECMSAVQGIGTLYAFNVHTGGTGCRCYSQAQYEAISLTGSGWEMCTV